MEISGVPVSQQGRRARRAAACVVAALVIGGSSGCQGDPQPKFAPSSPTISESSSDLTPRPDTAGPRSKSDTITAWIAARNDALSDGDVSAMTPFHAKDCRGCAYLTRGITEVYQAGGFYETTGWEVLNMMKAGKSKVDVRMRVPGGTTVNAAGEQPVHYDASVRDLRFVMTREGGRWAIANIGFLDS